MSKRERVEKSKLRLSIVRRLNIFKQAVKLTSCVLLSGSDFLLRVFATSCRNLCHRCVSSAMCISRKSISRGNKKPSNNNYDSFLSHRALAESLQR